MNTGSIIQWMKSVEFADSKTWFQKRIVKWGRMNFSVFPWRFCKEPIHQLIAEVLLQRTRAEQVVPVFEKLVQNYPNITEFGKITLDDAREFVSPLGLHWRAPKIVQLVRVIISEYHSKIPNKLSDLLSLPGIGAYAASAFLSLHRSVRASIVDSNVVKVYSRFFGFQYDNETRRKNWFLCLADAMTPLIIYRDYNYALLDFARSVCIKRPLCSTCTLNKRCNFRNIMNLFQS